MKMGRPSAEESRWQQIETDNDYEDLKTTHIEKVEAIRAEYLEKFLAATTRIKELEAVIKWAEHPFHPGDNMTAELAVKCFELEAERDAARQVASAQMKINASIEAATIERCAQVADPVRPDLANAIRALKLSDDKED